MIVPTLLHHDCPHPITPLLSQADHTTIAHTLSHTHHVTPIWTHPITPFLPPPYQTTIVPYPIMPLLPTSCHTIITPPYNSNMAPNLSHRFCYHPITPPLSPRYHHYCFQLITPLLPSPITPPLLHPTTPSLPYLIPPLTQTPPHCHCQISPLPLGTAVRTHTVKPHPELTPCTLGTPK